MIQPRVRSRQPRDARARRLKRRVALDGATETRAWVSPNDSLDSNERVRARGRDG